MLQSATAAAAGNPGGKGPSLRQDTVGLTDEIGRTHAAASLFVCCLKPAPIVHLASSCDRATVLRHVRARGLGAAEIRKTRGLDWSTAATVLTGSSAVFAALLALAFESPSGAMLRAVAERDALFARMILDSTDFVLLAKYVAAEDMVKRIEAAAAADAVNAAADAELTAAVASRDAFESSLAPAQASVACCSIASSCARTRRAPYAANA
ncbi:hypothetical protein T492DRAFT_873649 [Pavlovales sp. CCMP2436]|nr:hypothetical protein T492DRAFT_873649 [Pavlovales sp. CCMP2436]